MSVIKTKDVIAFIKNNEKIGIEMLPALYDIFDNLIDENESLRQEVAKYKQLAEEWRSDSDKIATLGKEGLVLVQKLTAETQCLQQEIVKYKQLAEESQSDRDNRGESSDSDDTSDN